MVICLTGLLRQKEFFLAGWTKCSHKRGYLLFSYSHHAYDDGVGAGCGCCTRHRFNLNSSSVLINWELLIMNREERWILKEIISKVSRSRWNLTFTHFIITRGGTFQSRHIQCGSRNFKIQWTLVKMNKSNKVQRNIEKCKFCPNVIFCWQPTAARKLWPEKYFNIHVAFVSFRNIPKQHCILPSPRLGEGVGDDVRRSSLLGMFTVL